MSYLAPSKKQRGQIALEAVIIVGFILLLMIPLLHLLFSRIIGVQDELRILEAVRSVDTLTSTISTVGVLGPNGSARIELTLPNNIKNLTVGSTHPREIVATLSTTLGDVDIARMAAYNVTGSIRVKSGQQKVTITYYEGGLPIVVSS